MATLSYASVFCLLGALASCAGIASAHPSVSVVVDKTGAIYYSDLSAVWVIRPDGTKEIAVADVHTHALWLSADGVLYGEDVSNRGAHYRHRVWALTPQGELRDAISWREGHPSDYADYSFVRDDEGRSYVLRRSARRIDVLREGTRERSLSFAAYPGPVHEHHVYEGSVYVAVGGSLLRLDGETASAVASGLVERTEAFQFVQDRHALMGMWHDVQGGIYVSVFAGQAVKRVSPQGNVQTVASSEGAWSVVGGTFDAEGALLLLEWSTSNEARIRRIGPDGREEIL